MSRFYNLFFLVFIFSSVNGQYLISSTFINTTPSIVLSLTTGLSLPYDVDLYKMTYNTVDASGQPTIATGAFLLPGNANCIDFPILVYHHGTTLKKQDVPSNDVQETIIGKIFCAGGYFALMPDYIGMGDSPGLHPYCHGESEATASRDMIRAAREFITDSLNMIDNGQVKEYEEGYKKHIASLEQVDCNVCDATGKRQEPPKTGAGDVKCNGCGGTGKKDDWEKSYPFSEENVRQFANFCLNSGGFRIC